MSSKKSKVHSGPRVLFVDIETAPILARVWKIWEENVGLNQIEADWHLLSWCAKWQGDSKVLYQDQRHVKNVQDDKALLKGIWKLLDEADIVVWQNGKRFDHKKLNARFILNGMKPPSSYKQIDTMLLAKKHFGFTSNKLEYLSDKLCVKYKKLTVRKFAGYELWKGCLSGNRAAWVEMEKYNKNDVLALEEVYDRLIPWDSTVNFNLYRESTEAPQCKCGCSEFQRYGYAFTATAKFQRYQCKKCGAETRGRENLFSPEERAALKASTSRS